MSINILKSYNNQDVNTLKFYELINDVNVINVINVSKGYILELIDGDYITITSYFI